MVPKIEIEKFNNNNNNNIKGLLSEWGLTAKPCDICHTASALLYCRADATFLCGACDLKVHAPVSQHLMMMARHERVWMCEVCEQAPAAVTCKADAAVLCASCDHDIHSANPLARRHGRVPVVPFFESVSDAADRSNAATDVNSAFLANDDGDDAEAWLIPNPNSNFLYNESYLLDCGGKKLEKISQKQINQQLSYDSLSFAISDSVVPTQSQENLNFPNKSNNLFDTSCEIDFTQPAKHNTKNKYNNNNDNDNHRQQIFSSFDFSANQHSVSSSEIGVVPEGNTNSPTEVSQTFVNSVAGGGVTAVARGDPVTALDREARVLRYREKRKNRKFEKTIRYASRKAYAETRPRIKGRFAKRSGKNENSDLNRILGSDFGSNFMLEQDYGVVPTF